MCFYKQEDSKKHLFLYKGRNNLEIDYHAKHKVLAQKKKKKVVDTKMLIMDTNKQNYTEGLTLFWDSSMDVDVISYV